MNKYLIVILFAYIVSCKPIKNTVIEQGQGAKKNETQKGKRYLPLCISYQGISSGDSIKSKIETLLAINKIKIISNDEAKNLQEVEVKRVYSIIFSKGLKDPNEIVKEAERLQKKVVNKVSIEFNYPQKIKWTIYSLPLSNTRREVGEMHEITAQELENMSLEKAIHNLAIKIVASGELKEE
jgi:hypothetical protein